MTKKRGTASAHEPVKICKTSEEAVAELEKIYGRENVITINITKRSDRWDSLNPDKGHTRR